MIHTWDFSYFILLVFRFAIKYLNTQKPKGKTIFPKFHDKLDAP